MSPRIHYRDGTTPKVCIIGAGLAGICAAAQLKSKLKLGTLTIFDREHDVGGVWLVNKYPGCQTDAPGFAYSYSFNQNPGWKQLCPDRAEYWKYLQNTAKKYDIYPHIQFRTEVKSLTWKDETKIWSVLTVNRSTNQQQMHEFNIVILGTGPLHQPNIPSEFDSFTGPKLHSAEWDGNTKTENQVVGVVGYGASALQIVPTIAAKTRKMVVFIREPNYVLPKPDFAIPWIFRLLFAIFPFIFWLVRGIGFVAIECARFGLNPDNCLNKLLGAYARLHLRRCVRDKNLRKALTPSFILGYKMPGIANSTFFDALQRDNVMVQTNRISKIEGQTIVTEDGTAHHLDVLILCTGFKVQDFFSPIQIFGLNGVNLMELWRSNRPETYHGVTCHEAPNMFFLLGPNASSASLIFMIECQVTFVIRVLMELASRNAASIQLKLSAQNESMDEMTRSMKNKIWSSMDSTRVHSWLVNERGWCTIFWPKSPFLYWWRTRRLDCTKFEFVSRENHDELGGGARMKYRMIEEVV